jgi:hypothetical protein
MFHIQATLAMATLVTEMATAMVATEMAAAAAMETMAENKMNEPMPVTANPPEGINTETGTSMGTLITRLIIVLVVLGVLGAAGWYFGLGGLGGEEERVSYEDAIASNQYFASGEELRLARKYTEAIAAYEQALGLSQSAREEGMIKLRLAIAKERGSAEDQIEAIQLFKEIAANESYSDNVRAYAVFDMAEFLSTSAFAPVLANEAFKDAPYATMRSDDTPLTYRKLAEYASSFYPIAEAEFHIALWYANEVAQLKRAATPDTQQIAADTAVVRARVESGDKDLVRIQSQHDNLDATIPYVLLQKAKTLGVMENAGESVGDAEDAFRKTIVSYATNLDPNADGFVRYFYALYLNRKEGTAARERVKALLNPLYADSGYAGRPFEGFLEGSRTNLPSAKAAIQVLAKIDAGFKTYLTSLGWTAADFK